jgi:hypothetical protein
MAARDLDDSVVSFAELRQRLHDSSAGVDNLVGMAGVKERVAELRREQEFLGSVRAGHWALRGLASVDVDDVASALAFELCDMGCIRDSRYFHVSADFLRGMYKGHTGKRAEAVMSFAQGTLVVIDSLESLSDASDSFCAEAAAALLAHMVSDADTCVVFAGDTDLFFSVHHGIGELVSNVVDCGDYTAHEACILMQREAKQDGLSIARDAWIPIQREMQRRLGRTCSRSFASALLREAKRNHIATYAGPDAGRMTLLVEDFDAAFAHLSDSVRARRG